MTPMIAKLLLDKVNEVAASRWKQPTINVPVIDSDQQCGTEIKPIGYVYISDLNVGEWISYKQNGNDNAKFNPSIYDASNPRIIKFTKTSDPPPFVNKDTVLVIRLAVDRRPFMYKVTNLQAILSEYVRRGVLSISNDKLSNYDEG